MKIESYSITDKFIKRVNLIFINAKKKETPWRRPKYSKWSAEAEKPSWVRNTQSRKPARSSGKQTVTGH